MVQLGSHSAVPEASTAVVTILRQQVASQHAVQASSACTALQHLAGISDAARLSVVAAGAVDAIIDAIKAHPASASVVDAAYNALFELTTTADDEARILGALDSAIATSASATTAAAAEDTAAQAALQRVRERLSA